jgi:hypothetical protein
LPIESTILAYEAQRASAAAIATAIAQALPAAPAPAKILIANQSDTAAILQLRIVLAQANLLNDRIDRLTPMLKHLSCVKSKPLRTLSFSLTQTPLGPLFSTPTDIASMVSTAASLTAENESLSTAQGNLGNVSLSSLVAEDIVANAPAGNIAVYTPSTIPPHLLGVTPSGPDLHGTYLYSTLNALEESRNNLESEADDTIGTKACQNDKSDPNVAAARTLVTAATSSVDAFESSLFSVSAPSAAGVSTQAGTSGKPSAPQQAASSPNPPGPSLSQLLYADLMIHALALSDKTPSSLNDVYILSLQALESGGSQLNKQRLFAGTHSSYSGGAVAAFSLVRNDGSLACSGVTYGYRGFIKADDFAHAITPLVNPTPLPGTNNVLPDANAAPVCQTPR